MHRSRLFVLVIAAAAAGCSTRDHSDAAELLAQDPTLVKRLQVDQETRQLPLPTECGTVSVAAQPAAARKAEAKALARRAYEAESLGEMDDARSLLRRATELDATDPSAAYHLGRASEALGDRVGAMSAYCRFLALTPSTAESAEARQRVATLSQPVAHVAAGSVADAAQARRRARAAPARATRVARARPARQTVPPAPEARVASAAVDPSAPAASVERGAPPATSATEGGAVAASPAQPATGAPAAEGTTVGATAAGDVVATSQDDATADRSSTGTRTERRGPSRVQAAGVGAVTGAIIGAAAGRNVKSAVIGAAAGGLLGTVIGGRTLPIGRGIRP